jgi:hypothetical protein
MTTFVGTASNDLILRHFLSSGVATNPAGASGTLTGEWNLIDAGAGDDIVALGNGVLPDKRSAGKARRFDGGKLIESAASG